MKKHQVTKKKYPLEHSPLYKLSSKRRLAELLGVEYSQIANLQKSGLTSQYNIYTDKKTQRFITQPLDDLEKIHQKLLKFCVRIQLPDYIHSAVKRKSYKTNAEAHLKATRFVKIDIKKFFPTVKFQYVHFFFLSTLKCSPDISVILAKLCTVSTKLGTHLPTGSCISPVLSFLANQNLFDNIQKLSNQYGCTFTLYVDDITISGPNANSELLTLVANEIHKHGYKHHKYKVYNQVPAKITGLFINNGNLQLPHDRRKKIRDLSKALEFGVTLKKSKILASLIGRLSEAEQVNSRYRLQRLNILNKYKQVWREVVQSRAAKIKK
jgi:RNA-directed DNA polymerase